MNGAARDHPEAVASVLARLRGRSGVLAQTVQRLTATLDAQSVTRLLSAVSQALPTGGADDAHTALAAEAERLGQPLPDVGAAVPSAKEVERQLRQALGYGATPAGVDRVVALGRALLAQTPAPNVALLVAEAELERGRWEEAARVVPDPASLATSPYGPDLRRRAHGVRGRAAAARGALAEAAKELATAGALEAYSGHRDLTRSLADRVAKVGPDMQGHVRFIPIPSIGGERSG